MKVISKLRKKRGLKENCNSWSLLFSFFIAFPGFILFISIIGYFLLSVTYTIPLLGNTPNISIDKMPSFLISISILLTMTTLIAGFLYITFFKTLFLSSIFQSIKSKTKKVSSTLAFGILLMLNISYSDSLPTWLMIFMYLTILFFILSAVLKKGTDIMITIVLFTFSLTTVSLMINIFNMNQELILEAFPDFLNYINLSLYISLYFVLFHRLESGDTLEGQSIVLALLFLLLIYFPTTDNNSTRYSLLTNWGLKLSGLGGGVKVTVFSSNQHKLEKKCKYLVFSDFDTSWTSSTSDLEKPYEQHSYSNTKLGCE